MTTGQLVEHAAQPVDRWAVARERTPQVGPRCREVRGRSARVIYTPALGVVIVRAAGAHAPLEGGEGARGRDVDLGHGVEVIHTQDGNDGAPHRGTAEATTKIAAKAGEVAA